MGEFGEVLGNLGGISAIISPVAFIHSEFCINDDFAVFIGK
jgi:hypothetical protein